MTKTNPLATIKQNDFNFSAAMQELEDITAYLEQADVDLDQALVRFERGAELAKQLKQYLRTAENKIEQLQVDFSKSSPNTTD